MFRLLCSFLTLLVLFSCSKRKSFDTVIRNGTVYDGSGGEPYSADIGIVGDSIAEIGDLSGAEAKTVIDAKGMAVAPGFINMLSWATESLLLDGKSQSDIRQGVTLEVFGEGISFGPVNDDIRKGMISQMRDYSFEIPWTTLGEYLEWLEKKGVSPNVASFVGATTLRIHELGMENRAPTPEELGRMKDLARNAMEEGALGIGSSLIYAPGNYAGTDELIELCKVASEYGGIYITHMRSEGNSIYSAVGETIKIAREAKIPSEIYHLKMAGTDNWNKLDTVIQMISAANESGLHITADMYTYPAGATGLDAAMPPWVQEGGIYQWMKRMGDPAIRKRVANEMRTRTDGWENLLLMAGSTDNVLLVGFANDSLKRYTGKTLSEVARINGKSPEETAMDLVIADSTRVSTVYFMMSEDNIKRQLKLPYVSLGSDAESSAPEGAFLKSSTHPRAYGNFARFLAKYIREDKIMPLQEGIRRLTSLPASNLKIKRRGTLAAGNYADIVVFDPAKIQDHATFENPMQYATGMSYVLVNGTVVMSNGEHTGATPGRVVRGPGWTPSSDR
ncbi:D-aminoacylase [Chryseolinea sp. T2]|uniref:N-acyl-D-amino-acid deacylase family protein n=1 Tax=Chryseolinea sp. T2 TaxID=3129255 RepID=UPI0030789839